MVAVSQFCFCEFYIVAFDKYLKILYGADNLTK